MQSLNAIAAGCEARVNAARQPSSHLIFEARLEAIGRRGQSVFPRPVWHC